ncbi:hypothetical protein COY14_03620 [Candidatus Roizmanbacteria bacterium CG_4_10_14_0_2_um_filter_36_9]|uniref:Uncharacterized protein n=1 Tax=Candidatus Roizmanbacteria bacterium CG_4_10_14_0_2_um_filter_36_9 TaxID=1974823 RepID=A0A2M7U3A1_9BACT|nr:MAG: hypothetical protein COY14_03620 [Candidatus Roizmanbacteria bacterium CG_4_10_14_0_2_um_filter_36_9]
MTKPKKRVLGHIVTDARVPLPYRQKTQEAGWYVIKVKDTHSESSDEKISEIYGKNRRALLTTDKTAHTHNASRGFIGYIYIDGKVSADEDSEYLAKFSNIVSTINKDIIEGYLIIIDKKNTSYERKKISKR